MKSLHVIFILVFLFSCSGNKPNESTSLSQEKTFGQQTITIDSFSVIPSEIDGGACCFSTDSVEFKKGNYIYVNDFAKTSFMKINGTRVKYTQTEYKSTDAHTSQTKAKSENYELIINVITSKPSGEEASLKTGTITITDKAGNKITKAFYGECGC